jgi:hypothetical protein
VSDGDQWPDEPDEPTNPGEKYLNRFDPETDAEPEADLAPSIPDETDAPEGLFRAFWSLVATINLGLFAASLGLMLMGFRGDLRNGSAVFLLGVAALAYAGYKYRQVRHEGFGDDGDDGTEEHPGDDEAEEHPADD